MLFRSVATVLATPREVFRKATPAEQARVLAVLRDVLPVSRRSKGLMGDGTLGPSLQRYDLERIVVPTLVISAEDDLYGTFNPARYTADHIPGARFVGYPTGGHLLVERQQEALARGDSVPAKCPELGAVEIRF